MKKQSELTTELIKKYKIIAIMRKVALDNVLPVAEALYDGGIRLVEVTFDQSNPTAIQDTAQAIKLIDERFGGQMCVGAGTVLSTEQVEAAVAANAKYIIAPNFNFSVVHRSIELDAVAIPGALTPTEIVAAHEAGAGFVKLFPAGDLGIGYIKAVRAPLNHIKMLAVGGVDENNLKDFFAAGIGGVGIGSNIVKASLIKEKKFSDLSALAKKYTEQI